jgi:hypothetical protein
MAINTKSLGAGVTPETDDGRLYPQYLHSYERFDGELLRELGRLEEPTPIELSLSLVDPNMRAVVSPWVASAQWRGLIERIGREAVVGSRRYRLTDRGRERLDELA